MDSEDSLERRLAAAAGEEFRSMCRTCLAANASTAIDSAVAELLWRHAEVRVYDDADDADSELPTGICLECLLALRRADVFRAKCRRSDELLRSRTRQSRIKREEESDGDEGPPIDYGVDVKDEPIERPTNSRPASDRKASKTKEKKKSRKRRRGEDGETAERGDAAAAKKKSFACDSCGKSFAERARLRVHAQKHSRTPRPCPVCAKPFKFKCSLKRHVVLVHDGRRRHVCDVCGRALSSMHALRYHMQGHERAAQDGGSFACAACPARLASVGELRAHARAHGEYACDACGARYCKKAPLKRHILRRHLGVGPKKPFACHLCALRFVSNFELARHLPRHDGKETFACAACPAKFLRRAEIARHMRLEHGLEYDRGAGAAAR